MSAAAWWRSLVISSCLVAAQGYSLPRPASILPEATCEPGYGVLRAISSHEAVCYEKVRHIKVVIGASAAKEQCNVCTDRSHNDCSACVTVVGPCTDSTAIDGPITKTILPAPGSGDPTTVIILTPTASPTETTTVPYTGTSSITAPITITTQTSSGQPPLVIVSTPPVAVLPGLTSSAQGSGLLPTVTTTGTGGFPTTRTVPPSGSLPGSVIVEEPPTDPISLPPILTTATSTTTTSVEIINTPAPEDPEETPVETPGEMPDITSSEAEETTTSVDSEPTLVPVEPVSCDSTNGYLIDQTILYAVDLQTGDSNVLSFNTGPGGDINTLGINELDNLLYGFVDIGNGEYQVIQIGTEGDYNLLEATVDRLYTVAAISSTGQLWATTPDNTHYVNVDLDPSSATFGQVVREDDMLPPPGGSIIGDWAFISIGGPNFLYSITNSATPVAIAWSTGAIGGGGGNGWSYGPSYSVPELSEPVSFGSVYANGIGVVATDDETGSIIIFDYSDNGVVEPHAFGAAGLTNPDGARCAAAPVVTPLPT